MAIAIANSVRSNRSGGRPRECWRSRGLEKGLEPKEKKILGNHRGVLTRFRQAQNGNHDTAATKPVLGPGGSLHGVKSLASQWSLHASVPVETALGGVLVVEYVFVGDQGVVHSAHLTLL